MLKALFIIPIFTDDNCYYCKFGLEEAADGEEIIHAELRLLQKISIPGDYYEVNIYYVLNNNNNTDSPLNLTLTLAQDGKYLMPLQ